MGNRSTLKTVIALVVIACLAVILGGCGSEGKSTDSSGETTAATASNGSTGTTDSGETAESGDDDASSESETTDADTKAPTPEPPPIQILGGDFSGVRVDEATIIIARSNREFNALKRRHFSHGVKQKGGGVIGADFKSRQMVGLFLPPQKPGVVVQILSVEERDGKIVVGATKMRGGRGCKFPAGSVRPFHIVESRKMQGKPTLELEVLRASDC